jgi:preprotein translocase subunit SecE
LPQVGVALCRQAANAQEVGQAKDRSGACAMENKTTVSLKGKVKTFWDEVVAETVKCEWPSRQSLMESTVVVIFTVVLLSVFVGISDRFLVRLIGLLTPTGG